jgi:uncharacterized protein (TIGR02646 family)
MRSVNKNWDNPPQALAVNNLALVINTADPTHREKIARNIYANASVTARLLQIYNFKCAYCETYESEPEVEHYRPKKSVQNVPGHLGYYWLCYEWSNLLPACHDCNKRRSKGTHFPIEGVRVLVPALLAAGTINLAENRLTSTTLSVTEVPLLLNPEFPDFNPFIYFKIDASGKLCPVGTPADLTYRQAAATIDTIRLNRDKLWLLERKKPIEDYMNRIRMILLKYMQQRFTEEQYNGSFREILQEIRAKTQVSKFNEYWFFWNYFYTHFRSFLSAHFRRRLRLAVIRTYDEVRPLLD